MKSLIKVNQKLICSDQRGALMIEFLIVLALVAILLTSGLDILGPSLKIVYQSEEREFVSSLIQEQFEVVRSIRDEDWNALSINGTYHYEDIVGEEEGLRLVEDIVTYDDKYEVGITLSDVYRDASGEIIETGDLDQIDTYTRVVNVSVSWTSYGVLKNESQRIYLTNWGDF